MSNPVPQSLLSLAQEMDHTGQQLLLRWEPEQARRFGALVQCLQGLAEQSGAEPLLRANAELATQLRGWARRRRSSEDVLQLRQQLSLVTQLASLPLPEQSGGSATPLRQSHRLFLLAPGQSLPGGVQEQLACFGYVLDVFDSLPALQQALQQHEPGALIIHHAFDGSEPPLPQLRLPCPLLFTSQRRDFAARLQAVRAGGQGFVGWPLSVRELLEALARPASTDPRNPLRVLLVEDMSSLAGLYAAVLNRHGIMTEEVNRPSETLEAIERFHPDLILMDMHMPECNGQELARIIRQQQLMDGIPILFLTMEKRQDVQLDALSLGVDGYLTKPVSSEELVVTVSTRASRYRKLRSYIATDSLTGLLNHSHLFARLEHEFARAQRERKPLSMVMLDLDHFKRINDSYGHQAGDEVLVSLSRFLQERLRRSDVLGRYGGEEFAIALPGMTTEQAVRLLDELREAFARLEHASPRGRFRQTFSAGVCSNEGVWDVVALVQRADSMLYRAKEAGRNGVLGWTAELAGGE
ncbi:diguanylate cyclase [Vogesella sp. LIG4]|uniref:GGDEF domain-containing response regulator n=1 Tax=Vogesella sp. LIG4 TaxID=1192162 RepID=UPI00081FFBA8|nr:diguanylate cyclase [Vogesella sp. LIG4]SCK11220.1 diguanylate cyclase (GGDEF) domain-containing protein [Vogesella sp. LIG4]